MLLTKWPINVSIRCLSFPRCLGSFAHAEVPFAQGGCSMFVSSTTARQRAKSKKVSCKFRDHVESHMLHWVANLPNAEHASLFKEVLGQYPKHTEGVLLDQKLARKLALYGDVLVPILERDGSIPQDAHFQGMLKALNLNAYKISNILEYHYAAIRRPSQASA